MESLVVTALCVLLLVTVFYVFTWPIRMGKNKGLPSAEMKPILILNWCALLSGITWFIALYLASTAKSRPLRRR